MKEDDLADRVRRAQGEYDQARDRVKASEGYAWWRRLESPVRFVIGAAVGTAVVVSLVSCLT